MKLTGLYTYPIKSLGGISLQSCLATNRGLQYDRRWMLVDAAGNFLTQREHPKMVWLQPEIMADQMVVTHRKNATPKLIFPLRPRHEEITVQIWDDQCSALLVSNEADHWFSEVLQMDVRLVYMPDSNKRLIKARHLGDNKPMGQKVSFSDGAAYLIIGQSSLDALNQKLTHPMTIHPFRPNFVFSGGSPHSEDDWQSLLIGKVSFRTAVNWGRCPVTTVDAATGQFNKEPLKTLATYRKVQHKIYFGQSLLLDDSEGREIKVGDPIVTS